jgi:hypothetical protein
MIGYTTFVVSVPDEETDQPAVLVRLAPNGTVDAIDLDPEQEAMIDLALAFIIDRDAALATANALIDTFRS